MSKSKINNANVVSLAIALAGGESSLARKIGIRQQSVHKWIAKGRVPVDRVADVALVTGIPKALLNPIFK